MVYRTKTQKNDWGIDEEQFDTSLVSYVFICILFGLAVQRLLNDDIQFAEMIGGIFVVWLFFAAIVTAFAHIALRGRPTRLQLFSGTLRLYATVYVLSNVGALFFTSIAQSLSEVWPSLESLKNFKTSYLYVHSTFLTVLMLTAFFFDSRRYSRITGERHVFVRFVLSLLGILCMAPVILLGIGLVLLIIGGLVSFLVPTIGP